MRPRLLDAFCGAGGAGKGYEDAGFEVVGIDHLPQPDYPCEFVLGDAVAFIREYGPEFDAIHASPPCQAFTAMKTMHNAGEHADLLTPTREALIATGLPYVIENVVGAPLLNPIMLCGSSFGLGVRRHRLFESNVPMMALPCAHHTQSPRFDVYEHGRWFKSPVARVYGHGGGKAREHWSEAMGIDWMGRDGLSQAIPPAYCEHVGRYLMLEVNRAFELRAA